jgi:hypothetical protein
LVPPDSSADIYCDEQESNGCGKDPSRKSEHLGGDYRRKSENTPNDNKDTYVKNTFGRPIALNFVVHVNPLVIC